MCMDSTPITISNSVDFPFQKKMYSGYRGSKTISLLSIVQSEICIVYHALLIYRTLHYNHHHDICGWEGLLGGEASILL